MNIYNGEANVEENLNPLMCFMFPPSLRFQIELSLMLLPRRGTEDLVGDRDFESDGWEEFSNLLPNGGGHRMTFSPSIIRDPEHKGKFCWGTAFSIPGRDGWYNKGQ
jgi:hypothetical protein